MVERDKDGERYGDLQVFFSSHSLILLIHQSNNHAKAIHCSAIVPRLHLKLLPQAETICRNQGLSYAMISEK